MVKRPSIIEASEKVEHELLCFLHYRDANSEEVVFTEKRLAVVLPTANPRIIHFALEELGSVSLVHKEDVGEPGEPVNGYSITRKGIKHVEEWDEDEYVAISEGIDFLEEIVPASDRVVSLDDNSAEYRATVESVDKVIEELKKDQPLDNEFGQKKHALLRAIEGGRRLLDDTRMNVEIGVKLLLEPLILVAKKYTQVLLGALAGKAVDLVSKLLGLD